METEIPLPDAPPLISIPSRLNPVNVFFSCIFKFYLIIFFPVYAQPQKCSLKFFQNQPVCISLLHHLDHIPRPSTLHIITLILFGENFKLASLLRDFYADFQI